jgi:hypothetical protein
LRGPNIKVSDDRPMWGGLDFRLGSEAAVVVWGH